MCFVFSPPICAIDQTTSALVSGRLNAELCCLFKCDVCEVDTCHNSGVRTTTQSKAKISEGFSITKSKALSFAQRLMASVKLMSDEFHFEKSKGAAQNQHVVLVNRCFEDMAK